MSANLAVATSVRARHARVGYKTPESYGSKNSSIAFLPWVALKARMTAGTQELW
jgi:hypothetical protein